MSADDNYCKRSLFEFMQCGTQHDRADKRTVTELREQDEFASWAMLDPQAADRLACIDA